MPHDTKSSDGLLGNLLSDTLNATASLLGAKAYGGAVGQALADAGQMLEQIAIENGVSVILNQGSLPSRTPLVTTYVLTPVI